MKRLLLAGMVCWFSAYAQQPDAPSAVLSRALEQLEPGYSQTPPGKCGTPLVFDAYRHLDDFPAGVRMEVLKALQRPSLQKSKVSPSGHFRVHYDTTGTNTPQMIAGNPAAGVPNSYEEFTDSACAILDHVWDVEIDQMGYEAPPADNGDGIGPEYDVYIVSNPVNVFGETDWTNEQQYEFGSHVRFASFITVDNDFLGFRTSGLNGLRVTLAHEFHHAIQIGSYGFWTNVPNSDFYFYELTSVWMEDMVYNNVNDYYFDLPTFFNAFQDALNESYSFAKYAPGFYGYERSIWDHYLAKRFGNDLIREIWTDMKTDPALPSMDRALRGHGSSLPAAFAEFAAWNLYTGLNADTVRYYSEGRNYPGVTPNASGLFSGMTSRVTGFAYPLSIQYYRFALPSDSIMAVVSNVDFNGAYANPGTLSPIEVSLTNGTPRGAVQSVGNGLSMGFIAGVSEHWRTMYWGKNLGVNLRQTAQPSPNPIRLGTTPYLMLPADGSAPGEAQVYILSVSLDVVFWGNVQIVDSFGKKVAYLPSSDLSGNVNSGVYFVVLKTKEQEYRWKVAILQ